MVLSSDAMLQCISPAEDKEACSVVLLCTKCKFTDWLYSTIC